MIAYDPLRDVLLKAIKLDWSFEAAVTKAAKMYSKWGVTQEFLDKKTTKVKKHLDEL